MKNILLKTGLIVVIALFTGLTVGAQDVKKEEKKVVIKVVKDGKTVVDTTYLSDKDFDSEEIESLIGDTKGEHKMIKIIKSDGDGEKDIEVIVGGEGELHEFHSKGGNVMFFGEDEKHKSHKGHVRIDKIDGDGKETTISIESDGKNVWTTHGSDVIVKHKGDENLNWTSKDDNVLIELKEIDSEGKGEFEFFGEEKKGQISLDPVGDGVYRLEFESDELQAIIIEVFNGEGDRMFKKKVKNFYGRFLKEIHLADNEVGLFTVRVLQGEKEIIGEFEYK